MENTVHIRPGQRRRRWSIAAAILASLFLVLFSGRPAFTYNVTDENARWASQPAPFHCCAQIHVQYNTFNYPGTTQWAMDQAVNAWNADSGADIEFYKLGGNLTAQDEWNAGDNWYGNTAYSWSPDWYIGQNHFNWAHIVLNAQSMSGLPAYEQIDTAIHEMGHSVGLGHTYGCIGIMEGTSNFCGFTGPTSDDNNGINHLY